MASRAMRSLLTDLVDYAGLYPPAALDMPRAVENFARYRMGEHEWMLSRFVCPASRLKDLSKHGASLMPGTNATSGYREYADAEPWRISAVIEGGVDSLDAALDLVDEFNAHHAAEENGLARVDMLEIKTPVATDIDAALDVLPASLLPCFEIPLNGDPRGHVAAIAGESAIAKIRTGGVKPEAFPSGAQIASFLVAAASADVAFKATAGLHHPVRGQYPLTYEPSSPTCAMHGFLNLFLTAALVKTKKLSDQEAANLLDHMPASAIRIAEDRVELGEHSIDAMQIAHVREGFALSFGSCSFDEPVEDLTRLGMW
ncbi:MAG: hypothetical protein SFZ23_03845 [Planctomycetota bacterium]|nr:hypothetical protein [Planctomycetota bacterium]